jgi:hypothetical protein
MEPYAPRSSIYTNWRASYFDFAFAAFLANGDVALPALMAAQRFLAASTMAFRPAALNVRFFFFGAFSEAGLTPSGIEETVTAAKGFAGGRPRRFPGVVPCNAIIAVFNLSRSAISKLTI